MKSLGNEATSSPVAPNPIAIDTGAAVRRARRARGMTQIELAASAGISRQALGAIEAGLYQPGVTVALRLAREVGQSVENLFGEGAEEPSRRVAATWREDRASRIEPHARVALGRVSGRLVAISLPAPRLTLAPAGGVIERAAGRRAEVSTFMSEDEIEATLLVAGCDPSIAILGDWLARRRTSVGAMALRCSSNRALAVLLEGRVHAAGVHLRDARTGEYNLAPVRKFLGKRHAVVVGFAEWELGLATAAGNPLGISGFEDVARPRLRIANRERGSGARSALDEAIAKLGIKPERIAGYRNEFGGHLEVAGALAAGQADVGMTIRVAADVYGLGFVPIRVERYDLVIPEREMAAQPVVAMLDALNSRRFAREVSQLCGYDTAHMGEVASRLNTAAAA